MKFKVRYMVLHHEIVEGPSAEWVAGSIPSRHKLLGVIPADQEWPDTAEKPAPRPPRNTPPSGSPGTPTTQKPSEVVHAVAA